MTNLSLLGEKNLKRQKSAYIFDNRFLNFRIELVHS